MREYSKFLLILKCKRESAFRFKTKFFFWYATKLLRIVTVPTISEPSCSSESSVLFSYEISCWNSENLSQLYILLFVL